MFDKKQMQRVQLNSLEAKMQDYKDLEFRFIKCQKQISDLLVVMQSIVIKREDREKVLSIIYGNE